METSNRASKIETAVWNGYVCLGATHLLTRPKSVILNSSQGKQPTGDLPWLQRTLEAVRSVATEDMVLLTSVDLNTWEAVCWAAGAQKIPQIVAIPDFGDRAIAEKYAEVLFEFDLDPDRTCAVLIPAKKRSPKSWWAARDEILISAADLVFPISIRKDGRMESLLSGGTSKARIDNRFRVPCDSSLKITIQLKFDSEAIRAEVDPSFDGWLIHWTRGADGPWPSETRADYYRAVTESRGSYSRSAERTLDRIASERLIRASPWRIRDKTPAVSLTALPPSLATPLMRWRSRYARYSFEPCGLAIRMEVAVSAGARPVVYLRDEAQAPGIPAWRIQSPGSKGDWPSEREFRHLGDLDLGALPAESWRRIDISGFLLGNG